MAKFWRFYTTSWIWGGAPPAAISSVAKYFRALFLNSSSVLSCHYTSFAPCAKKIMKHFFNKLQLASKIMSDKSWGPWMLFVVCPSKIFLWQPARSRHHVQLLCQWLSCLHGCVPMMKNVYTTCFLLPWSMIVQPVHVVFLCSSVIELTFPHIEAGIFCIQSDIWVSCLCR